MTSYAQIKARIAKLEKEAEQVLRKEAVKAIDTIKKIMEKYQLTLADLGESLAEGNRRGRRAKATPANGRRTRKAARPKPAAKYQNPKTGETWSGLGRAPAWIRDAIAKGKQDKFLIRVNSEQSAEETTAATKKPRAKAAKKATGKVGKSAMSADGAAVPAAKRGRKPGSKAAARASGSKKTASPAPRVSEGVASAAAE